MRYKAAAERFCPSSIASTLPEVDTGICVSVDSDVRSRWNGHGNVLVNGHGGGRADDKAIDCDCLVQRKPGGEDVEGWRAWALHRMMSTGEQARGRSRIVHRMQCSTLLFDPRSHPSQSRRHKKQAKQIERIVQRAKLTGPWHSNVSLLAKSAPS